MVILGEEARRNMGKQQNSNESDRKEKIKNLKSDRSSSGGTYNIGITSNTNGNEKRRITFNHNLKIIILETTLQCHVSFKIERHIFF